MTNDLMQTDDEYYRHLALGERVGEHTQVTTQLIVGESRSLMSASGASWLDIGCGSGYLVHQLRQRGWDAIGIEPGGWGQIAAREKAIPVVQGFLDETTFARRFEVISATDVVEHQPDPAQFLHLIRHYLSSTGTALITVPFADSFHGRVLGPHWNMVRPPTHCQFFTRRSLETILQKTGFELVRLVQYNASYLPILGRRRLGKMLTDRLLRATMGGDQVLVCMALSTRGMPTGNQ